MEGITGEYWQKCISHMMKEIEYYLELDGITTPSGSTSEPTNVEIENPQPSTSKSSEVHQI